MNQKARERMIDRIRQNAIANTKMDILRGKIIRVAVYKRLKEYHNQQITSIDLLMHDYKALAKQYGWTMVGVYFDQGCDNSGRDELIEECRAGHIDLIITRSIFRFGGIDETISIAESLLPVGIFFEEQNLYTPNDLHLMRQIAASGL